MSLLSRLLVLVLLLLRQGWLRRLLLVCCRLLPQPLQQPLICAPVEVLPQLSCLLPGVRRLLAHQLVGEEAPGRRQSETYMRSRRAKTEPFGKVKARRSNMLGVGLPSMVVGG